MEINCLNSSLGIIRRWGGSFFSFPLMISFLCITEVMSALNLKLKKNKTWQDVCQVGICTHGEADWPVQLHAVEVRE